MLPKLPAVDHRQTKNIRRYLAGAGKWELNKYQRQIFVVASTSNPCRGRSRPKESSLPRETGPTGFIDYPGGPTQNSLRGNILY